jgi:predicted SAM-dependent methyltransferase
MASKVGAKIIVDTSVLAGHVDKKNGITWGLPDDSPPVQRAKWLGGKDKEEDLLLALDLGAGGIRRQWMGYRTYTTDIRADSKPDYVQDTRWLNLPDGHFDLVASSHHLEHIPRWEQERVWGEVFRVCKPVGAIEHTVPSLEWAAAKIADGQADEHVFNVLYGAQESHGYERQFNLHYFGYTKEVARALAEGAGFVNVTCTDWTDTPELGYNLVIRGTKPGKTEPSESLPVAEEIPVSEAVATGGAA